MTAETQRGVIILLLIGILVALVKPDVFRKWTLEVTTEQTGREHDSESDTRPSPQNIRITPKAANA